MSSLKNTTFGRELTDEELATFHGGACSVTVGTDKSGNTVYHFSDGCKDLNINLSITVAK